MMFVAPPARVTIAVLDPVPRWLMLAPIGLLGLGAGVGVGVALGVGVGLGRGVGVGVGGGRNPAVGPCTTCP